LGLNTTNSYPIIVPSSPGPGLAWDLSGIIHEGRLGVISVATTPIQLVVCDFFWNAGDDQWQWNANWHESNHHFGIALADKLHRLGVAATRPGAYEWLE